MTKVPGGDDKYEIRVTKVIVVKKSEAIFDESVTEISIEDDAGGEYIGVSQCRDDIKAGCVLIDTTEWPVLRAAIDFMVRQCRDTK